VNEEVQDTSLRLGNGLDGRPATDAARAKECFAGLARAGELWEGGCGEGSAFHRVSGREKNRLYRRSGGLGFPGARVMMGGASDCFVWRKKGAWAVGDDRAGASSFLICSVDGGDAAGGFVSHEVLVCRVELAGFRELETSHRSSHRGNLR
jgi:hypothetical protein